MREREASFPACPFTPKRAAQAFTRIDLLALLAALAVLTLIAFPSIAGSRSAREVQVCFSNLRQLTRAWTLFIEDNSGRLPGNLDGGDAQNWANTNRSWVVGWLDNSIFRPDNTNTTILK